MLFTHRCTTCDRTQLIFPSQAHGVRSTDDGAVELTFTCWCGAEQGHRMAGLTASA
ncbi:hypothetical protein [Nocardioides daphniae]|uniref:Uncharacterized protein n=1 Tax=Nocardioides daphniae TaxID=402297 RepID=A0ABQ1Q620_9ACTN|nr:hypothetical protein [Nocardioides daphniae]GGD13684.1 hypothetical protein GCM10007231_10950 [Nocardioides daphniae]